MTKFLAFAAIGFCCFTVAAQAETMPDAYLQKDYDNCMGGQTDAQDPQRAQYCGCVRNGMRNWTVDEYGQVATETKGGTVTPDEVANLAKRCIAQVLH